MVVVEPAAIAEEEQGLRDLYVALTRPTQTLVVVHARPLPDGAAIRAVKEPLPSCPRSARGRGVPPTRSPARDPTGRHPSIEIRAPPDG